ncbi:uncharacterized protein LOC102804924 [Saccoglossus kowalevskii]
MYTCSCDNDRKLLIDALPPFVTATYKAPSVVIYDNACNLYTYFLNRDLCFIQKTRFYVDRLHWKNHTGCSRAYNLDEYSEWRHLNSQVVEQSNSRVKKLIIY